MTRLRVRYDGKVLVPIDPVSLPQGEVLEIDVHDPHQPPRGSPQALLQAMRRPPHVSEEDVQALEQAIEEAKQPIRYEGAFDDEVNR